MTKLMKLESDSSQAGCITEGEAVRAKEKIEKIIDNIETVIIGKREKVELTVLCMLAGGHILVVALLDCHKPTLIRCHKLYLRNGYGNTRNKFSIA